MDRSARRPPGEAADADLQEDRDEDVEVPSVPPDAPEADVQEQSRSWGKGTEGARPKVPPDVSEADALEQWRTAGLDDEDDRDQ